MEPTSGERYSVVHTRSANVFEWDEALERARMNGEAYIEVYGFESTGSSSAAATAGDEPGLSIGSMRTLDARPDGC